MLTSCTLGGQVQTSRDLARRARRLADSLPVPAERARLLRYAEELDIEADRLEKDAERRLPTAVASEPSAAD